MENAVNASTPLFWRDPRLPEVELRVIRDARHVAYALHSHDHWSLGAVTRGQSTFVYRDEHHAIRAGDLVLMNPGWAHACNPLQSEPWAYLMLYVQTAWVSELRFNAGLSRSPQWQDIATGVISSPLLYQRYRRTIAALLNKRLSAPAKKAALAGYLREVFVHLDAPTAQERERVSPALAALAAYLDDNALEAVTLDELCRLSGYSAGHLIRAFKRHFHMTPRAYLINRRVELGRERLKQGHSIADTALTLGFNDQPHFQRTFKRLLAATPKQYRTCLIEQDDHGACRQQ
nr:MULTISPECIES: AraC family transcriptional regulator [unclassified Halomonas]